MNPLREHQERQGRSDEEMATDLSALLGRKISTQGYRLHSSKAKAPKAWADALGLVTPAPETDGPPWDAGVSDGVLGSSSEREPSAPPKAPDGARVSGPPSVVGEYGFAKQRLVQAYAAVGAGASMITHNQGFAAVADSYAPAISDAWIAAAKTNENVAKIVRFMESGGPVGELVVCHILLVLGWVYVSGRGPDLDAIYARQFAGYRVAAAAGRIGDEAERFANNGAAPQGAESPLGEHPE